MGKLDFFTQRKTWSGRLILSHRRQYWDYLGLWGVFVLIGDLLRIAIKTFTKLGFHLKWKLKELRDANRTKKKPIKIHDYAQWIDHLKKDKSGFVSFTDTPYVRQESDPKIYAFYLTQYHAIPENDWAHGKGFTEWNNVAAATPQFVGHCQPNIPYDLGFYNLLQPGVMERQVEIAQSYGVYGFCFYYYWFSGRKLLEKPLEYFLHSDIDFHFHLCWATENWSKRWDGGKNELIVEQHLSVDDADLFFTDILPFIRDPRYEQIKGKPLLVVYRVDMFEKEIFTSFFDRLNALAIAHGFNGFHLLCTNAFRFDNPIDYGCHGLVEFPPHGIKNENYELTKPILCTTSDFKIIDMSAYLRDKMHLYDREYPVFKTCFPGWDNTPRKLYNQGFCFMLTPEEFQRWLEDNIVWTRKNHGIEEQIVYINAWNEWGEGAILEPTTRYGYRNLDSLKQVVENTRTHHRK